MCVFIHACTRAFIGEICSYECILFFSLNPYSFDVQTPTIDNAVVANDNFPLAAIPLFVTGSHEYSNAVYQVIQKLNSVYSEFLQSEEGNGFSGQVCVCVAVDVCCACLLACLLIHVYEHTFYVIK